MRIREIEIKNFRCFKNLTVNFETFTSLVGENGTGKTSILEAINLALSPSFAASRISEQDFNNEDEGEISIKVTFDEPFSIDIPDGYASQKLPCEGVYLQVKRREKSAPGKALSDACTATHYAMPSKEIRRTEKGWEIPRKTSDKVMEITGRHLAFPVESDELPRSFYFDKARGNQSKIGFNSTLQRLAKEYNWRFIKSLKEDEKGILEKWNEIYDIIISHVDEKKLKDTFEPIKEKLKALFGSKFENFELSVLNLEEPFSKSFFSIRDDLNQIEHDGLGSGISIIVSYFLLETISQLAKEKLILLIDEPEMHLHPQLQFDFERHLRKSESQVILSTHSGEMADLGDWRSVKRLSADGVTHPLKDVLERTLTYKGVTATIEKHLDEIKKYFKDKTVLTRDSKDLLFSKSCILVEGPVDRYGIMTLQKIVGIDLSYHTIISCHGKNNIPLFQLLCRAFSIPFFTVFDLDRKPESEENNQQIISWALGEHHFSYRDSFENTFGTKNSDHKATETMMRIDSYTSLSAEVAECFEKFKKYDSEFGRPTLVKPTKKRNTPPKKTDEPKLSANTAKAAAASAG